MQNLQNEYVFTLIDRCAELLGSRAAVARAIMVARPLISNWRSGLKRCPIADVALLAALAGLDANEFAALAIIERYGGEKALAIAEALDIDPEMEHGLIENQSNGQLGLFSVSAHIDRRVKLDRRKS